VLASPATIACGGLVAVSSGHTPLADHCSVAGSGLIVQLRLGGEGSVFGLSLL